MNTYQAAGKGTDYAQKQKSIFILVAIFLLCSVVEYTEFLVLKTDRTFLAENIICKFFAIILICIVLRKYHWKWSNIGFRVKGIAKSALLGLALGGSTFFISYAAEFLVLKAMGHPAKLQLFITNFALTGQNITGLSWTAILICVLGNILNVWAEEGLFRGLFLQMSKRFFTFKQSNLIQSLLFGVWHIVMVVSWVIDGSMNIPTAIVMAIGYVALAGILAYEWGLCVALTGTIWAGVFEHFFNNFITNTLHVVTETGIDELQILRIVLSNILSLVFVLCIARRRKKCVAQDNLSS